jgi:hypothetical protein
MPQQPMSRVLAQDLVLRCVEVRGGLREVRAGFAYDPVDPYAVRVTVPGEDRDLRWVMCRSLLCRGLTDPVGQGDVQLWPSTDRSGRGVVVMDLWSADGHVVGEVSTRELYRFLTRTLAAVPLGSEHQHLDVDSLIDDLLSEAE